MFQKNFFRTEREFQQTWGKLISMRDRPMKIKTVVLN